MQATLLIIILAIGAPALKEKPQPKPTIQGEWRVESRSDRGVPSNDANIWIFSPGGDAEIRNPMEGRVVSNLTYTLSTDGNLKTLDFMESQQIGRPALPRLGIYKLDGDNLMLSMTAGSTPRPSSFDTSKASGFIVIVLKRVK